jgi:hypothetical protein
MGGLVPSHHPALLAHSFLAATRAQAGKKKVRSEPERGDVAVDGTGGTAVALAAPLGACPPGTSVLAWSHWRRRHQARAKRCHYQKRAQES